MPLTQQQHDQRSLDLHRLIVGKIQEDPSLLLRAGAILARWKMMAGPNTSSYISEWERLLASNPSEISAYACDPSEHGNALRQNSPLACLLRPKERSRFLKDWRSNFEARRS